MGNRSANCCCRIFVAPLLEAAKHHSLSRWGDGATSLHAADLHPRELRTEDIRDAENGYYQFDPALVSHHAGRFPLLARSPGRKVAIRGALNRGDGRGAIGGTVRAMLTHRWAVSQRLADQRPLYVSLASGHVYRVTGTVGHFVAGVRLGTKSPSALHPSIQVTGHFRYRHG